VSKWRFVITPEGENGLDKLDTKTRVWVVNKLEWLVNNLENISPLPLGGLWRGFFKSRVGKWRIIYEIEHGKQLVTIHQVGLRDKIYRRLRKNG